MNDVLMRCAAGKWTDLMRFLVRILGARTPPPRIEDPVRKMPLCQFAGMSLDSAKQWEKARGGLHIEERTSPRRVR